MPPKRHQHNGDNRSRNMQPRGNGNFYDAHNARAKSARPQGNSRAPSSQGRQRSVSANGKRDLNELERLLANCDARDVPSPRYDEPPKIGSLSLANSKRLMSNAAIQQAQFDDEGEIISRPTSLRTELYAAKLRKIAALHVHFAENMVEQHLRAILAFEAEWARAATQARQIFFCLHTECLYHSGSPDALAAHQQAKHGFVWEGRAACPNLENKNCSLAAVVSIAGLCDSANLSQEVRQCIRAPSAHSARKVKDAYQIPDGTSVSVVAKRVFESVKTLKKRAQQPQPIPCCVQLKVPSEINLSAIILNLNNHIDFNGCPFFVLALSVTELELPSIQSFKPFTIGSALITPCGVIQVVQGFSNSHARCYVKANDVWRIIDEGVNRPANEPPELNNIALVAFHVASPSVPAEQPGLAPQILWDEIAAQSSVQGSRRVTFDLCERVALVEPNWGGHRLSPSAVTKVTSYRHKIYSDLLSAGVGTDVVNLNDVLLERAFAADPFGDLDSIAHAVLDHVESMNSDSVAEVLQVFRKKITVRSSSVPSRSLLLRHKQLTFSSWNARSLSKEKLLFACRFNPDVLCVSEVWKEKDLTSWAKMVGMQPTFGLRETGNSRGGTAIFVNDSLPFTPLKLSLPERMGECAGVEVAGIKFASVYLIPAVVWTDEEKEALAQLYREVHVVAGDLNSERSVRARCVEDCRANRHVNAFRGVATHKSGTSPDAVDVVRGVNVGGLSVLPTNLSDHYILSGHIAIGFVPVLQAKNAKTSILWSAVTSAHLAKSRKVMEEWLQRRRCPVKATQTAHKFLSKGIRVAQSVLPHKGLAWKMKWVHEAANTPNDHDSLVVLRAAAEERLRSMPTHDKWRLFDQSVRIKCPVDKDELNTFYVDRGACDMPTCKAAQRPPPEPPPPPNNYEVSQALRDHKCKTKDFEGISPKMLEVLADCPAFVKHLGKMIADSLNSNRIPQSWKRSHVRPLPKKKYIDQAKGWRPVAITSLICRTVEKVIMRRLRLSFDESQFAYRQNRSSGQALWTMRNDLRRGMRNVSKPEAGAHDRYAGRHRGIVIAFDASNAFCRVPFEGCMDALERASPNAAAYNSWICEWLRGRQQCVALSASDEPSAMRAHGGLPQGSILGPLMWNVFVDPIIRQVKSKSAAAALSRCDRANIIAFADDLTLYATGRSLRDTGRALTLLGNRILRFFEAYDIPCSASAHIMYAGRRPDDDDVPVLRLDGGDVTPTFVPVTLLGVTIAHDASVVHTATEERLGRCIDRLTKLKPYCHPRERRMLYDSYGLSKLRYMSFGAIDYLRDTKFTIDDTTNLRVTRAAPELLLDGPLQELPELERLHQKAARVITGCVATCQGNSALRLADMRELKAMLSRSHFRAYEKALRISSEVQRASKSIRPEEHLLSPEPREQMNLEPVPPHDTDALVAVMRFKLDIGPGITRDSPDRLKLADNNRRLREASKTLRPTLRLSTDASGGNRETDKLPCAAALLFQSDANEPIGKRTPTHWGYCSYSGELAAIDNGLDLLDTAPDDSRVLWPCDSLSALQALNKGPLKQDEDWALRTWRRLHALMLRGIRITFVFTFSHCGSTENEAVDKFAGELTTSEAEGHPPAPWWSQDAARHCYREVENRSDLFHRNKMGLLDESDKVQPQKLPANFGTADIRDLCQLKTGACFRLGGMHHGKPEKCYRCGEDQALARGGKAIHHLFTCPAFEAQRREIFRSPVATPEVLWEHPRRALQYARRFWEANPTLSSLS